MSGVKRVCAQYVGVRTCPSPPFRELKETKASFSERVGHPLLVRDARTWRWTARLSGAKGRFHGATLALEFVKSAGCSGRRSNKEKVCIAAKELHSAKQDGP